MRGEFVSKIPIWDRIPMLATTDLCISLFSVLRSKKPTLPVRLLIQHPPSGRPRTVPGYGRRGPLLRPSHFPSLASELSAGRPAGRPAAGRRPFGGGRRRRRPRDGGWPAAHSGGGGGRRIRALIPAQPTAASKLVRDQGDLKLD